MVIARNIRVILADDHAMVRAGLAQLLEESPEILVVGQAGNGKQAVSLVKEKQPDVVIMDYTMPEMDGIRAIEPIRKISTKVKILFLSVHENVHYTVKALQAGAHGYVLKAAAVEELVTGIRAVASGRVYVSPSIRDKLAETIRNTKKRHAGLQALSRREFELLRLLGSGKRLQDCAKAMKISESTASTYRSRLMEKLNLETTRDIIRFALENEISD
jgi:DNA-binding NarL/FixJ family response regulator